MSDQHICLGGVPTCSGINPCPSCFEAIMLSPESSILSRALVTTGGPFTDPDWVVSFIHNFRGSWRQTLHHLAQMLPPTLNARETVEENPQLSEEQTAELLAAERQAEPSEPVIHEDPNQLGYPVDEKVMASVMSTIKGRPTATDGPQQEEEKTPKNGDMKMGAPEVTTTSDDDTVLVAKKTEKEEGPEPRKET